MAKNVKYQHFKDMKHSTPTPSDKMRQASVVALVIGAIAVMISILLAVSGHGDGSTWSIAFPGIALIGAAGIRLLNDRASLS